MGDAGDQHVRWFASRSGHPVRSAESVAVAVFEDAVGILMRYVAADDRAGRTAFAEVDEWFASDSTDHPFSFVSICDALALDVADVRSGLRQRLESRRVALRTEPRILRLTGRWRPEERAVP